MVGVGILRFQGHDTSVVFVIRILAGTFGTLVFRVGTPVSKSLFVGLIPCVCHYCSSSPSWQSS